MKQVSATTQSLLESLALHPHLLIDSFFLEFGVELNERVCPVRSNPLLFHQDHKYRQTRHEQPPCKLITQLKALTHKYIKIYTKNIKVGEEGESGLDFGVIDQVQSITEEWEKECLVMLILATPSASKPNNLKLLKLPALYELFTN